MGDAIRDSLAFAPAVGLSPLPIIAIVLMLSTPRARANGLAFLAGWMLGLAAIGTIVLLVAGGAAEREGPTPFIAALELALGALALAIGIRQWRHRPRGDRVPELPEWMRAVDGFGPLPSLAIAVMLSAANPKNLLLTIGAAAAIATAEIGAGSQAIALAVFVTAGTLGVIVPLTLYLALGARSQRPLLAARSWLAAKSAVIVTVLMALIAAKLFSDGLRDL